ncbi:MAG: hypothetical protein V3S02_00175 [Dehalococcoidales bacterium]
MSNGNHSEDVNLEEERLAEQKARERASATMWSLEIVMLSFALLIVVLIMLFQETQIEIVSSIAVLGLALVWIIGRRRGKKLYQSFYMEEKSRLKEKTKMEEQQKIEEDETIEDKVRNALRDRWR